MKFDEFDDYYFNVIDEVDDDKLFVLIIYDIVNNAKRVKIAKELEGYGFRIQKSAFEAVITKKKYEKLVRELRTMISDEDSIRVYKIIGKGQVVNIGKIIENRQDDIIVV